jgi:hypothetical protein
MGLGIFGARKLVDSVGNASLKLRTALTGELPPDARVRLEEIDADLQKGIADSQSKLNIIDAGKGVFYAGWRPAIGWVCAFGVASYFIPKHVLGAYVWVASYFSTGVIGPYPVDADGILELTLGLLGLATLRTIERKLGVSK